jgi:hypothetical protein
LLLIVAQRVGVPVYRLKAEMPASELADWVLLLREEVKAREPPSVEDVGADALVHGLGG